MTQKEAFDILKTGVNVYITGAAGAGKTHLLNMYIDYLREHDVAFGITASTGIAATHMGGVTIHSWTGLGVRSELTPYDLESLQEKQYLYRRIEKASVLIIDEVSMLHHFRLDMIDQVLRAFKRVDAPFGGMQVVLCGDFFQLPPVSRMGEPDPKFIYHSRAWKEGQFKVCYLEEQFRHNDDVAVRVLNDIRNDRVDRGTMQHIEHRFTTERSEMSPLRLYTHNVDVDKVNDQELYRLRGDMMTYDMETRGNATLVDILKKSCLAPEFLKLKVGAKVMFVKNNFEAGYANGTLGIVKELEGFSGGPVVETYGGKTIEVPVESWVIEEDGKIKAELKQYPLRLAWAITIHKSQGMSLDMVEVDLSRSFEKGMGYVALSRVRSWDGLSILGFNDEALAVDGEVLAYDKQLRAQSNKAKAQLYEMKESSTLAKKQETFLKRISPKANPKQKVVKPSTFQKTLALLQEQVSLAQIAKHRGVTEETVLSHIETLLEEGQITKGAIEYLIKGFSKKKYDEIAALLKKFHSENDDWRLAPVRAALGDRPSYRDIQLVRLFVRKW